MKRYILALLGLLMIFVLCGCGPDTYPKSEGPVTLTLACWVSDLELQSLVSDFNKAYPDYEIIIHEYYEQTGDIDSAISRMTLELITGKTADLFYLDSLDVMALNNSGILANLYPFMEADADFHEENYYINIMKLFELSGSLYELVPSFQLGGLVGPQSLLDARSGWSYSEFDDFEASLGKNKTTLSIRHDFLTSFMIQFALDSHINIEESYCDFENESFYEWLNFIGTYSNNSDTAVLQAVWLSGLSGYLQLKMSKEDALTITGYPSDYAGGPCAMALSSYGMSDSTAYPEACWAFLKLLLSESNQINIFSKNGFPMLKSIFEEQLELALLDPSDENSLLNLWFGIQDTTSLAFTESEAIYLLNLLDSISYSRFRYSSVQSIIEEDIEPYLSGGKSVEETAHIIQSRVSLFLQEQE